MARFASVEMARWGFYESLESFNGDTECTESWFETLYIHYQNRGRALKKLREEIKELKKK